MLPQKIDKTLFVGTSVWFFFIINYAKLIPYGLLGQFSTKNLGTSLALAPLAPFEIRLGIKAHKMLPEVILYRIAYILVLVADGKLLWDGIYGTFSVF